MGVLQKGHVRRRFPLQRVAQVCLQMSNAPVGADGQRSAPPARDITRDCRTGTEGHLYRTLERARLPTGGEEGSRRVSSAAHAPLMRHQRMCHTIPGRVALENRYQHWRDHAVATTALRLTTAVRSHGGALPLL